MDGNRNLSRPGVGPWRFIRLTCCIVLMVALTAGRAGGTVVPAMSFDAMLGAADTIFRGEVVSTLPAFVDSREGRAIRTLVVFRVDRMLKGAPAAQIALEFLGGTIGAQTFAVAGVPRFRVGERAVLFVRRQGTFVSPIVGFYQGRFPIQRNLDTGADVVTTHDGLAFASVTDLGAMRQVGPMVRTIGLEAFERVVRQQLAARVR